jgi:hypothetical protein
MRREDVPVAVDFGDRLTRSAAEPVFIGLWAASAALLETLGVAWHAGGPGFESRR